MEEEGLKISEMTELESLTGNEYIPVLDSEGNNKKVKASLLKGQKGDPGSPGTPGTPGEPGEPGADGKSITAIELTKGADGVITSGTATMSDGSKVPITITVAEA